MFSFFDFRFSFQVQFALKREESNDLRTSARQKSSCLFDDKPALQLTSSVDRSRKFMELKIDRMAKDSNRLLRKEVESLNARLKKFNQENDDLLQRLSELKFQKEHREEEFEQDKLILRTRIRDLEKDKLDLGHQLDSVRRELDQKGQTKQQASREDELNRRQVESLRQEHVRRERELLERLNSIRTDSEAKERGWKKEVDQLKMTVQSKLKTIDEMRLENDRLMARNLPLDEERRLRQEVTEMKRTMETEARDLRDARRENDELRKNLDERNEGIRRLVSELNEALRLKERELDEVKREIVRLENTRNADPSSKEREDSLRREIDRLTAMVDAKQKLLDEATKDQATLRRIAEKLNDGGDREARLEREVDRLSTMLTSKERQLQETMTDRLRLQKELERLVSVKEMASDREGQALKKEVEKLTVIVRSKEVLLEDSLTKNTELSAAKEQLERDLRETRSFLKSTSDTNQELVDKNLRLERALAKTKAASEQVPDEKVSPYLRTFLKEQESQIEDLQRQVGSLRTTIMDNAKTKQLAILAAEFEPDHKDTNQGEGILRELKQARKNLDFSQRRISQLENWLDEIYTTTGVIGGGVGSVGRPMARQRTSANRSILAASKRTARGVLALPGIADLDENIMKRSYSTLRSNRRTNANRRTLPSWNSTTCTS